MLTIDTAYIRAAAYQGLCIEHTDRAGFPPEYN